MLDDVDDLIAENIHMVGNDVLRGWRSAAIRDDGWADAEQGMKHRTCKVRNGADSGVRFCDHLLIGAQVSEKLREGARRKIAPSDHYDRRRVDQTDGFEIERPIGW